jgi:hypothetical protein
MATKKKAIQEFIAEEENLFVTEVPEAEIVETETRTDVITARVKGSWTMFWGRTTWNFQDGQRYKLPRDLFDYLKRSGNIYDTL